MALLPGTARAQRHHAAALLHVDEERNSAFFAEMELARSGTLWQTRVLVEEHST